MTARGRLVRVVAAAALLFGLTGCMTLEGQLEVHSDDTVSGAFVVAVERPALAASGVGEAEFLTKLDAWNPVSQLPAGGRAEEQPYIADHLLGKKYIYDRVPLSQFGAGGTWRIQHRGDAYVVTGVLDLSGAATQPGISSTETGKGWDILVQITFPGDIRSANGKVSGRTVSWQPQFGQRSELAVEAGDGSSGFRIQDLGVTAAALTGPGRWVLAAGVAGEITLMTVSALLVLRRRRRRALVAAGGGRHLAGPGFDTGTYAWRVEATARGGARGRQRAR